MLPCSQRFPSSGTAVFANFSGKGGLILSSGGHPASAVPSRALVRLRRGSSPLSSVCGCNCVRPYLSLGPRSCLRPACRWQTAAKTLATSQNGWKEDGCDCRRGGKGNGGGCARCPGGVTRCQAWCSAKLELQGWVVRGGALCPGGLLSATCSDGVRSAASYPRVWAVI